MNTTDYFTYVNAMFIFCIFTCGLLVWAVIRWFNIKRDANEDLKKAHDRIKQYDMDIANETRKYDALFKQHIERGKRIIALEVAKDNAEKESRDLRKQLTESEKQANGYKAEFIAASNELEATKSKVRKRDANGKFLPSWNGRVKNVKAAQPKLVHGLTVKNPTEDEAKMIFDEARRLGVDKLGIGIDDVKILDSTGKRMPHIWYSEAKDYGRSISWRIAILQHSKNDEQVVTAKEFVQRMRNGRG